MRLFFWNLARKSLADLVHFAVQLYDVDVAAFAEADQTDFQRFTELLAGRYQTVESIDDKTKTKLLVKSSICSQQASAVIKNLTCTLILDGVPVNTSIVHG